MGGGGVRVIIDVVSNIKWRGVLGDRRMIQSNFGRFVVKELMVILFCKK